MSKVDVMIKSDDRIIAQALRVCEAKQTLDRELAILKSLMAEPAPKPKTQRKAPIALKRKIKKVAKTSRAKHVAERTKRTQKPRTHSKPVAEPAGGPPAPSAPLLLLGGQICQSHPHRRRSPWKSRSTGHPRINTRHGYKHLGGVIMAAGLRCLPKWQHAALRRAHPRLPPFSKRLKHMNNKLPRRAQTTWVNSAAKTPPRRGVPVGYERDRLRRVAESAFKPGCPSGCPGHPETKRSEGSAC